MAGPLTIKLRCASWGQLEQIYNRDLIRSAIFLKTKKPPPVGTPVRINLTLPSETLIILSGQVNVQVGEGGLGGRGPGVDIALATIPQSAMWLIESALASAKKKETSSVRQMPVASANQATRQRRAASESGARRAPVDPNLEDGEGLVDAERDLVAALRTEFAALRKLNAFQLLGVGYDADDQKVRDAFGRLTKKYHPDRFARYQSTEARELASEIFILTRDAYRRVGSPRAREQTLRSLGREAPSRTPTPVPRRAATPPPVPPALAPTQPRMPTQPPAPASGRPGSLADDDLFGNTPSPVQTTSVPLDLSSPRKGSGELDRADALVEADRHQEAMKIYQLLARRTPGDLRARAGVELCEGLDALDERDRLEAAQRFEMVLELDPENERAARELADMRRQATQDRKGLLARLLGKKE